MTLPPDARLVPRADVAAREIDDGVVLVNLGSGACFELNRIGFEIWLGCLGVPGASKPNTIALCGSNVDLQIRSQCGHEASE
jgi:hypothetical protein